jgi:hypothetical protein
MSEERLFTSENYPKSYALKQDIRSKEVDILNIFAEIGDLMQIGRGVNLVDYTGYETLQTGRGLCALTTSIMEDGLRQKYPDITIGTMMYYVGPRDLYPDKRYNPALTVHGINPFNFPGEIGMFMDSAHGQYTPWLNRIVIDVAGSEPFYFSDLRRIGPQPRVPVETYVEKYKKTNDQALNTFYKQQRFYSLVRDARALIAA